MDLFNSLLASKKCQVILWKHITEDDLCVEVTGRLKEEMVMLRRSHMDLFFSKLRQKEILQSERIYIRALVQKRNKYHYKLFFNEWIKSSENNSWE